MSSIKDFTREQLGCRWGCIPWWGLCGRILFQSYSASLSYGCKTEVLMSVWAIIRGWHLLSEASLIHSLAFSMVPSAIDSWGWVSHISGFFSCISVKPSRGGLCCAHPNHPELNSFAQFLFSFASKVPFIKSHNIGQVSRIRAWSHLKMWILFVISSLYDILTWNLMTHLDYSNLL